MIGFGNSENAAQPTAGEAQTLSRPTPASAAPTSYRIQAGDTLRSIAQRAYGDQSLWWVIYQANRGSLTAPDDLRIGQEIIIPSR
jgi:nucleoid-associated protein YgaU